MNITLFHAAAVSASLLVSTHAFADRLTVISFGGANKDAQKAAFYDPFKAATNHNVVRGSYDGDFAKLREMIAFNSVSWDVLEVEASELTRGCVEGLFENIDPAAFGDPADYVPGALQPCGVGIFVRSAVMAYNRTKISGRPDGWADFWNLQKFPGKRGLRWGAKHNLEFALMADGVAARDVYATLSTQAGVDRAFRKLDEIRSQVVWWKSGQEPVRSLEAGQVAMSSAYNGRIAAAQSEQPNLALSWRGGVYDFDYWALPKGALNTALGKEFIQFASQPAQQKSYAEHIAYGPVSVKAAKQLNPATLANLPTAPQNITEVVAMDVAFWAVNGPALERRFEAWAR